MAVDIGQMTERVRIETAVESRNSVGETVQDWSHFGDRWASVETLSSREYLAQGQQQLEVTHRVRMRYVDGMEPTMRLVWRGLILEIVSLLDYGNRSRHELLCLERQEVL
jgi:SPP1 family predicted phage head-tail adaptor